MTTDAYTPTARTTPTRLRERVSYDREAVHAALDEAVLCHVAFVVDGAPAVFPQLHVRVGETLYLHGSAERARCGSRVDEGLDVCVTVDAPRRARARALGLPPLRELPLRGRARAGPPRHRPEEKDGALRHLVDAIVPGRSDHVRGPSRRELAATAVLRLDLEDVSYKHRAGPPGDDEEDLGLPWWAGVLPVRGAAPATEPAPRPDGRDRGPRTRQRLVARLGPAPGTGGRRSGARRAHRLADEVDDGLRVGQHHQVRGVDLAHGHAGAAVAEALDLGVDGAVRGRDEAPGRLGPPGGGGGRLAERRAGERPLRDREHARQARVDAGREDGRELGHVDVDVGAVGLARDRVRPVDERRARSESGKRPCSSPRLSPSLSA